MRGRKLAALLLVGGLGLAALASLVGGGLLFLERNGYVTLRRVPRVSLLPRWEDERGETIAIVNTDTMGGYFTVARGANLTHKTWVPPRSVVLCPHPHRNDESATFSYLYIGRAATVSSVATEGKVFTTPPKVRCTTRAHEPRVDKSA